jgi:hypothetical protein
MDLRDIGLGDVDWIKLAKDRDRWRAVVSAVMNLRVLAPRSYSFVSATAAAELCANLCAPHYYKLCGLEIGVSWDVAPSSLGVDRRFRGVY